MRVLLFGVLKDRFGRAEETLELRTGASVAEVLLWARASMGDDGLLQSVAVAVNREYAGTGKALCEGDEVALLPPVSGGRH